MRLRGMKLTAIIILLLITALDVPALWAQIDTVDFTQYDLQAVGPTSGRIALDAQGGVHVVYLGSTSFPQNRMYYGYRNPNGNWYNYNVGLGRTGFPKIALNSVGNPAILAGGYIWTPEGVRFADSTGYGLSLSYDSQDNLHLLYYKTPDRLDFQYILNYSRSTDNGISWSSPQTVDSLGLPGALITSSPVSGKSAIIYSLPIDSANAYFCDIIYVESQDGINWDFQHGKINITEYEIGDYFATMDFDAIYDNTDLLNIVWVSQPMDTLLGPVYLWDYNANTENISEIAHTSIVWPMPGCDWGTWNTSMGKVTLVRSNDVPLVSVFYNQYSQYDCSQGGYANAEICFQRSYDSGGFWSNPQNVTNTHTPNCEPGDCESETNPSIARTENGFFHLFYVEDKDAGGVPYTEGSVTANPLKYVAIVENGVADNSQTPSEFALFPNYPNPFNAVTTIEVNLPASGHLDLAIYDVTGSRLTQLVDDIRQAGINKIKWDANDVSAGVYFCGAKFDGKTVSQKMVLLK